MARWIYQSRIEPPALPLPFPVAPSIGWLGITNENPRPRGKNQVLPESDFYFYSPPPISTVIRSPYVLCDLPPRRGKNQISQDAFEWPARDITQLPWAAAYTDTPIRRNENQNLPDVYRSIAFIPAVSIPWAASYTDMPSTRDKNQILPPAFFWWPAEVPDVVIPPVTGFDEYIIRMRRRH